jgi:hypothetical protein
MSILVFNPRCSSLVKATQRDLESTIRNRLKNLGRFGPTLLSGNKSLGHTRSMSPTTGLCDLHFREADFWPEYFPDCQSLLEN